MTNENAESVQQLPSGFTRKSSGLSSEYAREQGWGINQDERTKTAEPPQDSDGGRDYDYGARDFGDSPAKTNPPKQKPQTERPAPQAKKSSRSRP